mgnify:CR=1 FL=1
MVEKSERLMPNYIKIGLLMIKQCTFKTFTCKCFQSLLSKEYTTTKLQSCAKTIDLKELYKKSLTRFNIVSI